MPSAATLRAQLESSLPERLSSTLFMRERAAPLTVSSGVAALDALPEVCRAEHSPRLPGWLRRRARE